MCSCLVRIKSYIFRKKRNTERRRKIIKMQMLFVKRVDCFYEMPRHDDIHVYTYRTYVISTSECIDIHFVDIDVLLSSQF